MLKKKEGLWTIDDPNDEVKEMVNHPEHYGGRDNPYEAIRVIEAWDLGFCLGNTIKYISRAGKKDDTLQELEKALWYLKREIKNIKQKSYGKESSKGNTNNKRGTCIPN